MNKSKSILFIYFTFILYAPCTIAEIKKNKLSVYITDEYKIEGQRVYMLGYEKVIKLNIDLDIKGINTVIVKDVNIINNKCQGKNNPILFNVKFNPVLNVTNLSTYIDGFCLSGEKNDIVSMEIIARTNKNEKYHNLTTIKMISNKNTNYE